MLCVRIDTFESPRLTQHLPIVRRQEGSHLALRCWPQLWQLRDPRYGAVPFLCLFYHPGDFRTTDNGRLATETKHFIYFYLGHCAILLFKTQ